MSIGSFRFDDKKKNLCKLYRYLMNHAHCEFNKMFIPVSLVSHDYLFIDIMNTLYTNPLPNWPNITLNCNGIHILSIPHMI